MLFTRPDHDITTSYLFAWCISLLERARKKRNVIDLAKKRANRKEFTSVIQKMCPAFIMLNGHGNESTVCGYNNEPLITTNENVFILNRSVVYARSCSSAKSLGPKSISEGCRTYIGYVEDFVFVTESDKLTHPLDDKTAGLFLEPANQIVISLLKGHTTSESNRRSKEYYKQCVKKLMTSDTSQEVRELIPYLIWNYTHQVCLGNQNACI